jgi:hypothetical protein
LELFNCFIVITYDDNNNEAQVGEP